MREGIIPGIAIAGNLFTKEIVSLLGASSTQAPLSIAYAKVIFTFAPAFFLQTAFQTFFVTAGKPTLGLIVTILAGITNIVLDYIFMAPLAMGVAGAAIATGIGYCIPAVVGILFLIISSIVANILIHLTVSNALTIFTPAYSDVYNITLRGFTIYSLAFIIMGLGIFSSTMFTAFSDGKTSAIISFSRTFIFIVGAILILPKILGEIGIWIAVPVAEVFGLIVAVYYLITKNNRFFYIPEIRKRSKN